MAPDSRTLACNPSSASAIGAHLARCGQGLSAHPLKSSRVVRQNALGHAAKGRLKARLAVRLQELLRDRLALGVAIEKNRFGTTRCQSESGAACDRRKESKLLRIVGERRARMWEHAFVSAQRQVYPLQMPFEPSRQMLDVKELHKDVGKLPLRGVPVCKAYLGHDSLARGSPSKGFLWQLVAPFSAFLAKGTRPCVSLTKRRCTTQRTTQIEAMHWT